MLLLSPLAASRKSVLRRLDTTPAARPQKHVRPNPVVAYAQETGPRKIGPDMEPPKLVKKTEPAYTQEARDAGLQGIVILSITVTAGGKPKDVRVVEGLGLGLDERAVEAVETWEFEPARLKKDNAPVEVVANIRVNFRLL